MKIDASKTPWVDFGGCRVTATFQVLHRLLYPWATSNAKGDAMFKYYLPLLGLLVALLSVGLAQEDGLYAPAPPADAAFVRVLHAVPDAPALSVTVADVAYGDVAFAAVSPYRVVTQGTRTLKAGDISQDLEVSAGKFYTLAITPQGVTVLEDASSTNRAKALLSLYNLSELPSVDLKTADGKTDVLVGVAAGTQKSIEVNGITVDLAVLSEGKELQAFPGVSLERGAAYSVVVLGTAAAPTVIWVQSETTTE
jgi:alginate O-acetyltransferase complex protein AlgF